MNLDASSRWERVKTVFQEALDLPEGARQARLDAEPADIAAEVSSLLAHGEGAEGVLDAPLPPLSLEGPPLRIGPYRILGVLGQGGMGTVYLGERVGDEFRVQVAIKCLRREASPWPALERFRQERRILASLEHPYIARLLDGGTTEAGLLYLVMERVKGEPITAYCRNRGLGLRARLELFREVCAAVHYAHQNLVVHRDLKPGNILVTPEGVPKLLDFGIAKLLAPEGDQSTRTLMPFLTPACASPEQVTGGTVTTASDVYALGVLLYELVTGAPPYLITSGSPDEILEKVCRLDPVRPSQAPAGSDPAPRAWRRSLGGDLDNIALLAMRKEATRRYGSAQQLAEDLRRHMEGLPVLAREETLGYRTATFIRRHRVWVAAGALVAGALLAGTTIALRQARIARAERAKAERRFHEVRAVANALLFEFNEAIRDVPGTLQARQLVVRRATDYLDRLAGEAGDDPALQRELATSYSRLAGVSFEAAGALASHRKALALQEALAARGAMDPATRLALAGPLCEVANCLRMTGDTRGAHAHTARALRLLAESSAPTPEMDAARIEALWEHSRALEELGRGPEALAALLQAEALAGTLWRREPASLSRRHAMIVCRLFLGDRLLADGKAREALEYFRQASLESEAGLAGAPTSALLVRDRLIALRRTGSALTALGRAREALAPLETTLEGMGRLRRADPSDLGHRRVLTQAFLDLGEARSALKDLAAARESFLRALDESRAAAAADTSRMESRLDEARALARLGALEARAGRRGEARDRLAQAASIYRALALHNPAHAILRKEVLAAETALQGLGNGGSRP